MSTETPPRLEFNEHGNHRLVADDGRHTPWASYTSFTFLDGWVGATAYWLDAEAVLAPADLISAIAVQ